MSEPVALALLGIAATFMVAAFASAWAVFMLVRAVEATCRAHGEATRSELWNGLTATEARLERRLQVIERTSHGFLAHASMTRGGGDGI